MDITKLDIKELKALAFDFLVERDRVNNNLKIVQDEITKRVESEKIKPVEESKDKKK